MRIRVFPPLIFASTCP